MGPVELVRDGQQVPLRGPRQRLVLAHLVLHANRVVTTEALIDEVWGDEPPGTARNALQSYISHLRRALGEECVRGAAGGYVLVASADEIDVRRFEALVARATASSAIDPAGSLALLEEALALWRGDPFADLASEPSLAGEIARLNELRVRTIEQKLATELALGRHTEIIGDLESLTNRHPLRERFWGQLLIALYRSDRQADALAAYQRARTLLVEQFGIDPSTELQDLQRRILLQDPDLLEPRKAPLPLDQVALADPEPVEATGSERSHPSRFPSNRVIVGVLVVAVLAVGLSLVISRTGGGGGSDTLASHQPGIAIIDAGTGRTVASIPTSTIKNPVEASFAGGAFWVLNLEPTSFAEIDPASGKILRQIGSPISDIGSFSVDGNNLWITDYTQPALSLVDIVSGQEVRHFDDLPGTGGSGSVVVVDGSVWVARREAGLVARLDPDTGAVQRLFGPMNGTLALSYGDDGAIWTGGAFGDVNRIDLASLTVTSSHIGGRNFYVAAGGGYGWTTDEETGLAYQIDRTGAVAATYSTGSGARPIAYSEGLVWVGNQDAGTVTSIDPARHTTISYLIDHPLNAIAAGAGKVLVEITDGETFDGRISGLSGQVARFIVGAYALEPPDPALVDSPLGYQIEHATCASLLRQSDQVAGASGEPVQPEVATDLPEVSTDRRTYTFTIRPGIRFSPPSGALITAETIRSSIERALSPSLGVGAPAPRIVADIVGEQAFRTGADPHISGLGGDEDHVTITLVSPSDDFLERISRPPFCPVPLTTPTIPGVGGAQLPDGETSNEFTVPSAGPYYIARYFAGEYTVLLRNPNYTGTRPRVFDAIVLREGIAADQAFALVAAGSWAGASHLDVPNGQNDTLTGPTIGCRRSLPDGSGIDLAAMCPNH